MNITPPQKALYAYMEHESENRQCAGWLKDLHLILVGDEVYEWLVEAAGGWFDTTKMVWFVPGTLEDLRRIHESYSSY